MKPVRILAIAIALAVLAASCSRPTGGQGARPEPLRVGALYPLSGTQGPGGVEEYRGVQIAASLANAERGAAGRPVELTPIDVPAADAAPGAVATLAGRGIGVVLGSYGSTISAPAARAAAERGLVFWETGAVGKLMGLEGGGERVFRVAPSGGLLGKAAMDFVSTQLLPRLGHQPARLRYAVVAVDDQFGAAVARGALGELHARGYRVAGSLRYDPRSYDRVKLVRQLAATRPDVLFVVAYLDDGVALRREIVRQGLRLVANIGTSSSYCMPAFGAALGRDAVGLFASDKPDAYGINRKGLNPQARATLEAAEAAYERAWHQQMSAAALAGFAGAWALFHWVLPRAGSTDPDAVARAARSVRIPVGGLPNGSGLEFGAPGGDDPSANLRAATVIWEWVGVNDRQVTWPPRFATAALKAMRITP
ncbi:MAG TPA: ABC transporter substrate-binding protein [Actinomycetes bacterium]|nr:ABC transporter substrate-binding protein [Actinomycetes bacterium]